MPDARPDPHALLESRLHSLPLLARGKVRDNYAVGTDRLLMVASDRISAFDVVMGEAIPGKGRLLTRMALFWFERLAHVVPNHLSGDDPAGAVAADERAQIEGRSMLVRRLRPLPVEAVVRGYLAGSGWAEYQRDGTVCGQALPAGLANASRLREPIFTPATKAEAGAHDENIDFEATVALVGREMAERVRDVAVRLHGELPNVREKPQARRALVIPPHVVGAGEGIRCVRQFAQADEQAHEKKRSGNRAVLEEDLTEAA